MTSKGAESVAGVGLRGVGRVARRLYPSHHPLSLHPYSAPLHHLPLPRFFSLSTDLFLSLDSFPSPFLLK